MKKQKGITLILTIIILLILVGITIVQLTGILEGKITKATGKESFKDIIEAEEKTVNDSTIIATNNIEIIYEKNPIDTNKMQILITIKDNKNGLKEIEYPDGDILKCEEKSQIAIDYTIEYEVEYIFKITSKNGYIKEVAIKEDNKLYLYKEGNEYEEITGGWEIGDTGNSTNPDFGSATKNVEEGYKERELKDGTWELDIGSISSNSLSVLTGFQNGASGKIRNIWLER